LESLARRVRDLNTILQLQDASNGGTLHPTMTDRINRLSQ